MKPSSIEDLKRYGRTYVHYPSDLRKAVEEAIVAWRAFYALSKEQKLRFGYDKDAKTSGNGYELQTTDPKEDFHLRVAVRDELMRRAHLVDDAVAPHFVETALALNPLMAQVLRAFGEAVEKDLGIVGFADDVMATQPKWLLRFLHYFGDRGVGESIAAPHVDKGGFTLHLYESDGGVERLDYSSRTWEPMPLSHDETVIIPGMGLQNRSKCELRALCHRVVATEKTAIVGRDSAVCFINFDRTRYFDKGTFGRLQDFEPGFFYGMEYPQFDSYFMD